jgi:hypothetical protein
VEDDSISSRGIEDPMNVVVGHGNLNAHPIDSRTISCATRCATNNKVAGFDDVMAPSIRWGLVDKPPLIRHPAGELGEFVAEEL